MLQKGVYAAYSSHCIHSSKTIVEFDIPYIYFILLGSSGAIVCFLAGLMDFVLPEGLQFTSSSVVKRQSRSFSAADPASLCSFAFASLKGSILPNAERSGSFCKEKCLLLIVRKYYTLLQTASWDVSEFSGVEKAVLFTSGSAARLSVAEDISKEEERLNLLISLAWSCNFRRNLFCVD